MDGKTPLRHIEVRISHLIFEDVHRQLFLFDDESLDDRQEHIENVIDNIRDRIGSRSIIKIDYYIVA